MSHNEEGEAVSLSDEQIKATKEFIEENELADIVMVAIEGGNIQGFALDEADDGIEM